MDFLNSMGEEHIASTELTERCRLFAKCCSCSMRFWLFGLSTRTRRPGVKDAMLTNQGARWMIGGSMLKIETERSFVHFKMFHIFFPRNGWFDGVLVGG